MSLASAILRRTLSTSAAMSMSKISTVTVIGSGLMGSGVAQVAAQAGQKVNLVDVSETAVAKAETRISDSLKRVAKKKFLEDTAAASEFVDHCLSFLKVGTGVEEAAASSGLVVEAIIENMDVKQKLFAALDKVSPPSTIFASNTSSLSVGEIASATTRQDRFVGLHFFNPVPVMKLLEVVRIPETSDDTYNSVVEWGTDVGKVTVACKDTPGFIVNRLLIPYMAEAARMLERGEATAKDIDTAMKLGAGYPMGPLELIDYVGLDTTYYIMEGWAEQFPGNPLYEPVKMVEKMFKDGKLGMKSGEGFYKY